MDIEFGRCLQVPAFLFVDELLDVWSDIVGLNLVVEAYTGDTIGVDEELLPVPADVGVVHGVVVEATLLIEGFPWAGALGLQKFEHWVLVDTIYFSLAEHLEVRYQSSSWADVLNSIQDFLGIATWFLQSKLVARETKDDKLILELFL